ncbi:MAG: DUF6431 domain-containing protein [Moorellaceae bacterium]
MQAHGSYRRKVKTSEGEVVLLPIRRYCCSHCRRTHALLPDFIAPYRHYSMLTIAKALEEVVEARIPTEKVSGVQDIPTTRRWVRRFLGMLDQVLGSLRSMAIKVIKKAEPLIQVRELTLRAALGRLPAVEASSILGAVNIWLTRDAAGLQI